MADVTVEVAPDHLQKLVRPTQPAAAVIELVWNALDADADNVYVTFDRNELDGIDVVTVADDGSGIRPSQCEQAFSKLGGSWKAGAKVTLDKRRPMHGRHGEGRFRSYALGNEIEWLTTADEVDGRFTTRISASALTPEVFKIGDPAATDEKSGTRVRISSPMKSLSSLESDETKGRIVREFARYLLRHKTISIYYDGDKLDPTAAIEVSHRVRLEVLGTADLPELEIIEWKGKADREIVFCDEDGFFLHTIQPRIQAPNFNFTAYVSWSQFDASEVFLTETGHAVYGPLLNQVRDELRNYFKERARQRVVEVVDGWKAEQIYPFRGDPDSDVERSTRDLFDVVAVQAIPALTGDRRSKKLSLRLIREALEQSPTALRRVLEDVVELSEEQIQGLADLLERTTLGSVISSARVVADRLDFLRSLEFLLFDKEMKDELLERTQLHRILSKEAWIFGDHFTVAVDDKGIRKVLEAHLRLLGRSTLNLASTAVEGKKTAIVDLMLTKTIETHERRHHLVVELKRPSVKGGHTEKQQIEAYGLAVANDPQFRDAGTRWDFVLVANELSPDVERLTRKKGLPPGCIHDDEDLDLRIWIKHWGGLIEEQRRSLHFLKNRLGLESSIEDGVELLRRKHAEYLPESVLNAGD